jgi:hypothetical protein
VTKFCKWLNICIASLKEGPTPQTVEGWLRPYWGEAPRFGRFGPGLKRVIPAHPPSGILNWASYPFIDPFRDLRYDGLRNKPSCPVMLIYSAVWMPALFLRQVSWGLKSHVKTWYFNLQLSCCNLSIASPIPRKLKSSSFVTISAWCQLDKLSFDLITTGWTLSWLSFKFIR